MVALGRLPGEMVRYGVIGAVGYLVDVAFFNLLAYSSAVHLDPLIAKVVAMTVATVVTWQGNRHFVFPHRRTRSTVHEVGLFLLFSALGVGISVGVLAVSHNVMGLTSQLADNISANMVGFGLATLFRFFAYRTFVFPAERTSALSTPPVQSEAEQEVSMTEARSSFRHGELPEPADAGSLRSVTKERGLPEPTGRIYSLQWLRFAAAAAVLVYHGAAHLSLTRGSDWALGFVPAWFGPLGVALFFALSGYLMSSAMLRYSAAQFLMHRVVRIYPTYFLVVLLVVLAGVFSPIQQTLDWNALSLLPYGESTYALGVEWSLVFEIAFYVFVSALILLRRQKSAATVLIGWLGIILIHNLMSPDNPAINVYPASELPFIGLNTGFAFGMLLPLIKIRTLHPVAAGIVGYAVWLWGGSNGITWGRWGMGLGCAYLVLSLARFTGWRALFGETFLGRLGNRLGNASYVLYLCHVPVVRTVYVTLPDLGIVRAFVLGIVLSLAISLVLGEIDMRLYRILKRMVDRSSRRVRNVSAITFAAAFCVAFVRFF